MEKIACCGFCDSSERKRQTPIANREKPNVASEAFTNLSLASLDKLWGSQQCDPLPAHNQMLKTKKLGGYCCLRGQYPGLSFKRNSEQSCVSLGPSLAADTETGVSSDD